MAYSPMAFERNQGQVDPAVEFPRSRPRLWPLSSLLAEPYLTLARPDGAIQRCRTHAVRGWQLSRQARRRRCASRASATTSSATTHRRWQTNIPNYAKVRYSGVYPGVDLVYYGNQQQLEYDFIVAPGADARNPLRSTSKAWRRSQVSEVGRSRPYAPRSGDLVQHRPVIYQDVHGQAAPRCRQAM